MPVKAFDTLVIGTGPAGEGVAMKLAKAGQRVAVIEAHTQVGGGCTHWGTIPSKALRHDIQMLADYRRHIGPRACPTPPGRGPSSWLIDSRNALCCRVSIASVLARWQRETRSATGTVSRGIQSLPCTGTPPSIACSKNGLRWCSELAGLPVPAGLAYRLDAEEVKQTAFRLDGVLRPEKGIAFGAPASVPSQMPCPAPYCALRL